MGGVVGTSRERAIKIIASGAFSERSRLFHGEAVPTFPNFYPGCPLGRAKDFREDAVVTLANDETRLNAEICGADLMQWLHCRASLNLGGRPFHRKVGYRPGSVQPARVMGGLVMAPPRPGSPLTSAGRERGSRGRSDMALNATAGSSPAPSADVSGPLCVRPAFRPQAADN